VALFLCLVIQIAEKVFVRCCGLCIASGKANKCSHSPTTVTGLKQIAADRITDADREISNSKSWRLHPTIYQINI
jgi:hypothetical protein